MKKAFAVAVAIALLCLGSLAEANITIETVAVGDRGNAADTTGYGSVDYNYNIGKYEVTAAQYCDFLNHKARVSDPLASNRFRSNSRARLRTARHCRVDVLD